MKTIRAELLRIIHNKLGDAPTPEQVVEFLHSGGSLLSEGMRAQVVSEEFFRLYSSHPERTARDIEEELAARYDLSRIAVLVIRLRVAKNAGRGLPGRKRKV